MAYKKAAKLGVMDIVSTHVSVISMLLEVQNSMKQRGAINRWL